MTTIFTEIDAQNRLSDKQAVKAMKQQGIQFVDIAQNDIAEWKRIAANARNQMISKGGYTKELVDKINTGLKNYRQLNKTSQASH
jgi:hypothetical protein